MLKPSEKIDIGSTRNTEYKSTHLERPASGKVLKTGESASRESFESLS